jgi:hypothetical protein
MKNTYRNFFIATFALGFVSFFAGAAEAQTIPYSGPVINSRNIRVAQPACQQPSSVYIRNLRYDDYTRMTRLSTTSVAPGGFFQIVSNCLPIDGQIIVTLQDVSRGPGFGVTAFRLTNVRVNNGSITAQAPNLPIFRNRTYHVAVFVYGQPWKTANPGQLTIR